MDNRERAFLKVMRARVGGSAAARANACAECAELLRTKNGSHTLLMELRGLVASYCPPLPDPASVVGTAAEALRTVAGRELTEDAIQKVVAVVDALGSTDADGERALLELWMQRPEVFSERFSRALRERWHLLTKGSAR